MTDEKDKVLTETSIMDERIKQLEKELIDIRVENAQLKSENSQLRVDLNVYRRAEDLRFTTHNTNDANKFSEITENDLQNFYQEYQRTKERKG